MSARTPGRLLAGVCIYEDGSKHFCAVQEGNEKKVVALTGLAGEANEQEAMSNAHRLAVCWNACDGLPTESLEKLGTLDRASVEMNVFRAHLLAQRDELLAALHRMENHPASRVDELPEMARAAIAKVKGGTT